MRTCAIFLLVVLFLLPGLASAAAVDDAYQQARLDYFALRKDEKRKPYRHHWMNVIERLDRAANRLRGEARCGALFNAGRAWHEVSTISYLQDDRDAAVARYTKVADGCPRSNLADDALFHMAELQQKRDPAAAARSLDRLIAAYAKGDRVAEARTLRKTLPAAKSAPAAPAKKPAEKLAEKPAEKPAAQTNIAEQQRPQPAKVEAPAAPREAPVQERTAAVQERTTTAQPEAGEPVAGENLPSAADILAALDAKGADANRPEDVALAEDLRRDRLAREADAKAAPTAPAQQPKKAQEQKLDPARLAALEKATGGEIPLSLAAGLKVKRVVIDPGHGGKDTGAIGRRGTREKDLTLNISRKLKKHLEAMGLEVLLTRNSDVFLELEERTRFANEKHADLFISVHVNAAENRRAYGIETYTLNLNSDRYAMRLAARENASSSKSIGDLQFILADLATKANTDDSVRLARLVQGEMVGTLRKSYGTKIRDLGVKQALFYVLVGAKMPAILVEAAFVSNPDEEQRLRTDKYQEQTARSIAEGVRRFIAEREAIAQGKVPAGSGVF